MKKPVLILLAIFFLSSSTLPEQKDIIEEADLMLDMMEYKAAIVNYLKALSQNPRQQDIRKDIGYAYFQLDKIDDALKFLNEELELFPGNEDAYDLLVYILYKLNKLEEADRFLEDYHFSAKLSEENPHIGGLGCFILGMHFKKIESYGTAKIYFRKALDKGHNPVKCYNQLIDIEFIQRMSASEVELRSQKTIFFEAVEAYGFLPEFLFLNGLRYFEKSKSNVFFLPWSIKSFKAALKDNPDFRDALFNLACISYNLNDFKNASEYFRRILELEPENAEVSLYLNCCLKKLSNSVDIGLISEQCPEVINLTKGFINKPDMEYEYKFKNDVSFVLGSINQLGIEFIQKGKFHEGLRRLRNGLKIEPQNPGFHFNIGMVCSWLNNLEEAEKNALISLRRMDCFGSIPEYRKQEILREKKVDVEKTTRIPLSRWTFDVALEEGNYFLDAYNSLGTIYFKKREFEKSILAFKKVIDIYPEDAMGHYNLGCSYKALEDRRSAEKEWKEAIKHEEKLKMMKERSEISENQLDVSLLVYKRAVSFKAHKGLGWLYLEENLPEKALKEFEKAIELEPGDPEPYYEVGKIYQDKSVQDEKYVRQAIFYYEKYLYLGGEKEKEVKKLLKLLK